jgi:molybdate transport system substrate-binding protein
MRTQISIAKAAAAIVGLLIALALSRDVAAQPAELRVLSSAAPRNVLTEIGPVFECMTGRKLVVEYAFSPDLKRRIEAGDPFDVAILPPDMADDLMGRYKLVAGSRVDLGRTGLGVAVRKGASPPDGQHSRRVTAPERLASLRLLRSPSRWKFASP